jgi:hypothetical protein
MGAAHRRKLRSDACRPRKAEYRDRLRRARFANLYQCRCARAACGARRTIKKLPAQYVREPRCRVCRGPLRVDFYRTLRRESRRSNCYCSEASWSARGGPHRLGWCRKRQQERQRAA